MDYLSGAVNTEVYTEVYTDIMLDIETGGLAPDQTPIIQIGAVKFNLEKKTVCPEFFDMSLTEPGHRFWDEGTRGWWMSQKASTLQNIRVRAQDWRMVMQQLQQFGAGGLRFWSKPTHFDFMFIQSYFRDAGLANPFHYRIARDMNSYIEALFYGEENATELVDRANRIEFNGDVHNALNDSLHQLTVLFEAVRLKEELIAKNSQIILEEEPAF